MKTGTLLATFATLVIADGLGDFRQLQTLVNSTAQDIESSIVPVSINSSQPGLLAVDTMQARTVPFNTADAVQNISYAMGASQANAQANAQAFMNGQNASSLDTAYFQAISEFLSLSRSLSNRGRAAHDEPNQPVSLAIDGLAQGVHSFGLMLTQQDIISDHSIIRTITAENSLDDAESSWSYSVAQRRRERKSVDF